MEKVKCPKCGKEEEQIRGGYTSYGTQRYLCKGCNSKYTTKPKGYSEETKQLAVKMYLSGVSGRQVGKILGVSPPQAIRWLKKNLNEVSTL